MLAERERKRAALKKQVSTTIVGTCPDMCPEFERYERELHLDVSPFEALHSDDAGGQRMIDHSKAVKKYHRPAAGNEMPLAEDVRPVPVLQRTLAYLVDGILDSPSLSAAALVEAQKFVRDRTRAIRQDLAVQDVRSPDAVHLNEAIARFHIAIDYRMRTAKIPPADYDPFQNMEQLRKVLITLDHLEDALAMPASDEFDAYRILAHLDRPEELAHHGHSSPDDSARNARALTGLAVKACVAFHAGDYVRFFAAMHAMPPLMAVLANGHADSIRRTALQMASKAYSADGIPVERICCDILCFESVAAGLVYLSQAFPSASFDQPLVKLRGLLEESAPVAVYCELPAFPHASWRDLLRLTLPKSPVAPVTVPAITAPVPVPAPISAPKANLPAEVDPRKAQEEKDAKSRRARAMATAVLDDLVAFVTAFEAARVARTTWKRNSDRAVWHKASSAIVDSIIKDANADVLRLIALQCHTAAVLKQREKLRRASLELITAKALESLFRQILLEDPVAMAIAGAHLERRLKRHGLVVWQRAAARPSQENSPIGRRIAEMCRHAGHRDIWIVRVRNGRPDQRLKDALEVDPVRLSWDEADYNGCHNAMIEHDLLESTFRCSIGETLRLFAGLIASGTPWPPLLNNWNAARWIREVFGQQVSHPFACDVVKYILEDVPEPLRHPLVPESLSDVDAVASGAECIKVVSAAKLDFVRKCFSEHLPSSSDDLAEESAKRPRLEHQLDILLAELSLERKFSDSINT